jgi:hypothetical protein
MERRWCWRLVQLAHLFALLDQRERELVHGQLHRASGSGQRDDHGELLRRPLARGEFWNVVPDSRQPRFSLHGDRCLAEPIVRGRRGLDDLHGEGDRH